MDFENLRNTLQAGEIEGDILREIKKKFKQRPPKGKFKRRASGDLEKGLGVEINTEGLGTTANPVLSFQLTHNREPIEMHPYARYVQKGTRKGDRNLPSSKMIGQILIWMGHKGITGGPKVAAAISRSIMVNQVKTKDPSFLRLTPSTNPRLYARIFARITRALSKDVAIEVVRIIKSIIH